jgi:hypothetical protein
MQKDAKMKLTTEILIERENFLKEAMQVADKLLNMKGLSPVGNSMLAKFIKDISAQIKEVRAMRQELTQKLNPGFAVIID